MDSKNKVTEFYLITGFLGAGKTTLLKNLIPLFDGKKLLVIMNEFGKEGVDGTLLEQRHIQLREINGGSVFCSCRLDQFEKVLTESLCLAPEVIIVEASGLSDPTNIRKILEEQEHTGALLYRGCICLVDAKQFRKVFSTARVCPRQLNTGDLILLNKSDLATAEERAEICILLHERYPRAVLHETTHGMISPAWLHGLIPSSRAVDSAGDKPNLTLQRATIGIDQKMSLYELDRFLSMFAEDTNRIKGFVYLEANGWILADCVGGFVKLTLWTGSTPAHSGLTILATAGMPLRKSLQYAASWYQDRVKVTFG